MSRGKESAAAVESAGKPAEKSAPQKFAQAWDDAWALVRQRPVVGIAFVLLVAVPSIWLVCEKALVVPKLEDRIKKLETGKKDAESARDKAEIMVAPFLAAANARFTNAPPDTRLDLLLSMMQDVSRRLPKDRVLTPEKLERVRADLAGVGRSTLFEVDFKVEAQQGRERAEQLATFLRELGFERTSVTWHSSPGAKLPPLAVAVSWDLGHFTGSSGEVRLSAELANSIAVLIRDLEGSTNVIFIGPHYTNAIRLSIGD